MGSVVARGNRRGAPRKRRRHLRGQLASRGRPRPGRPGKGRGQGWCGGRGWGCALVEPKKRSTKSGLWAKGESWTRPRFGPTDRAAIIVFTWFKRDVIGLGLGVGVWCGRESGLGGPSVVHTQRPLLWGQVTSGGRCLMARAIPLPFATVVSLPRPHLTVDIAPIVGNSTERPSPPASLSCVSTASRHGRSTGAESMYSGDTAPGVSTERL